MVRGSRSGVREGPHGRKGVPEVHRHDAKPFRDAPRPAGPGTEPTEGGGLATEWPPGWPTGTKKGSCIAAEPLENWCPGPDLNRQQID